MLIDWDKATYPYQDDDVPMLDAVIQRAKTSAVDAVYIDGDLVYADGRFTRIDRDQMLAEIAETLSKPAHAGRACPPRTGPRRVPARQGVLRRLHPGRGGEAVLHPVLGVLIPEEPESTGRRVTGFTALPASGR